MLSLNYNYSYYFVPLIPILSPLLVYLNLNLLMLLYYSSLYLSYTHSLPKIHYSYDLLLLTSFPFHLNIHIVLLYMHLNLIALILQNRLSLCYLDEIKDLHILLLLHQYHYPNLYYTPDITSLHFQILFLISLHLFEEHTMVSLMLDSLKNKMVKVSLFFLILLMDYSDNIHILSDYFLLFLFVYLIFLDLKNLLHFQL